MKRHPKATHAPLLLSVNDAGGLLGLSPWTIRQWCYTGKIASYKMGTRLLVSQGTIDQLLNESLRPRLQGCIAVTANEPGIMPSKRHSAQSRQDNA